MPDTKRSSPFGLERHAVDARTGPPYDRDALNSKRRRGSSARARRIAQVVGSLDRVFQAVHTFSKRALRDFGVTGPQIWALQTLAREGVLTVGELADRMFLHVSTVSVIVDRLEARGLVTRSRDAQDRRVVRLELEPRGRTLLGRVPDPPRSKLARGVARLSDDRLARVESVVAQLVKMMEIE